MANNSCYITTRTREEEKERFLKFPVLKTQHSGWDFGSAS